MHPYLQSLLARAKEQPNGCLTLKMSPTQKYPSARFNGGNKNAHRVVWLLLNGPIPPRVVVCHRCDNPACINPAHLFLGTNKDNTQDCIRKGRFVNGERNGLAKLTSAQVQEIRELRATGIYIDELAKRFGVERSNIAYIVKGTTWAHLPTVKIQDATIEPPWISRDEAIKRLGMAIHSLEYRLTPNEGGFVPGKFRYRRLKGVRRIAVLSEDVDKYLTQ